MTSAITIHTLNGDHVPMTVRVARTADERERGLRGTAYLAPNHGLLIVYPYPGVARLWMKDVKIDLDMLFVSPLGLVVGVLHNVPAQSTETRTLPVPSQYVIEAPAGFAEKNGVTIGALVRLGL